MSRRKRFTRNLGRTERAPLAARTTTEWVRFEHEEEPYGVFSYISDALESLDEQLRAELDELRRWFVANLGAPELDDDAMDRFWFRAEAAEHVERARRMAELVRLAGFPILERRTTRVPGKVRWEDPHQVCLLTYRDAPRPSSRRR